MGILRHLDIRKFFLLTFAVWTLGIAAILAMEIRHQYSMAEELARMEVRGQFGWMVKFRSWITSHGGVYVPANDRTPPNPYLEVPEKNIQTPSGKKLTLMNPAYVTRQIYAEYYLKDGVVGRMTSLKPINKVNTPDPWEREGLRRFEKGAEEKFEFSELHGQQYLRLLRPLVVERACMKCHEKQGYKEGDIRGGLSLSVPVGPYFEKARKDAVRSTYDFGAIWLAGMMGIFVFSRQIIRSTREREKAEEKLRESERGLSEAQRIAHLGHWSLDLVKNELKWSDEVYRIFEIDPAKFGASYESFLNAVHPDDRDFVNNAYTESVKDRKPYDIVHRLLLSGTRVKHVNERCETSYDVDGKPLKSIGTVLDITERKQAEDELVKAMDLLKTRTEQLERSNRDLEQFAFISSHDLQEPLRTVSSYVQLFERRYRGKLDANADTYIKFITGASSRMQQLINDLLAYSRVEGRGKPFGPIRTNELVDGVVASLDEMARTTSAVITRQDLPDTVADKTQLAQVFQNIIANAIKFHGEAPPAVTIGGGEDDQEWTFWVRDNGIGIEKEYADRIFLIFQRLHSAGQYEGTGIGLAISKKIIQRHGGRIWVESEAGKGSTFYFSIAKEQMPHNREPK